MNFSRREFLGTGAFAATGLLAGCISSGANPLASAEVPILRKAGFRGADDKLRMAFIGSGGRGGANLNEFLKLGENVVALCDVDLDRLDGAAKRVAAVNPKVRRYQDWRVLLEKETDLDAVVVSTPDHMHASCAIAAMERGCHVYVEKPLVRTWWEAQRFREVAKACGVVTQMGNDGNGTDGQRRSIEILQSGVLGKIREIHVTTNRPIWPQGLNRPAGADTVPERFDWNLWLGVAPKRPFRKNVYHAFKWRGWFDFGTGALGDMGCHLMSAFWRGLDVRRTVSVELLRSTPRFEETFAKSSAVKIEVVGGRQDEIIPIYWYDGDSGPAQATCRRLTNGRMEKISGTFIVGEKGVFHNGQLMLEGETKFTRHQDHPATRDLAVTLPRVRGHHWEFAEAVRGGARPFSDIDHSVPLTETVLLGCIAQRVPGRLEWNAERGRFVDCPQADELLVPQVRNCWEIG